MQDEYVLVLNTLSGDISFIDPKDDSVVGAVRVGEKPRDLVYLPGSRRVFVTLSGTGEVGMLDLAERRITSCTKVGIRPGHIYLHPSRKEVWIANDGSGELTVLHAESGQWLATIPPAATAHINRTAEHVRTVFRAEETDHPGDFIRLSDPPCRGLPPFLLQ